MSVIRKSSIAVLAAFLVSVALGSTAFAISIDFTTASWAGANNQSSFTSHPSGIDLFANVGVITVNPGDGLGITDDEIGSLGIERLTITFASPVTLQTVLITDLFPDEGLFGADEQGVFSLNGGAFTNSFSSASATGDLTLNINVAGVSSIAFRSATDLFSDYSVRGLTFATPEPTSVMLLGVGLAGIGIWRRKTQA